MAFKLQPGLILGGNLTLSPTGTPFIKDANWSKASTKPILVGVATNTAFASTSKYNADGSTVTGGTTIGGGVSSTTRWSSPLAIGVATNTAFASTSKYNADGSTVTGGATIGGGTSTTTRWSSPLEIGVATNTAFASTSKYNADGSTVTGGATIGGGTSTNASSELTARYYLVGATHDDEVSSNNGAVYVFDANNTSAQPTKLTRFDATSSDQSIYFGGHIAADSEKIVVTAESDSASFYQSGSVYVFDTNDLSAQPTKLVPPLGTIGSGGSADSSVKMGNSVAITSDKILVGLDQINRTTGAVWVYDRNDLSAQPIELTAFDGVIGDHFGGPSATGEGSGIAANSDKIVVAAHREEEVGQNIGSIYVFDANDLSSQPTKITPDYQNDHQQFGNSVAITSDKIVVGSRYSDDVGTDTGAVYVYDANDLSAQPTILTPSVDDAVEYGNFAQIVSATSDKIIVGAPSHEEDEISSGAVYVYDANDLTAQPTKLTPFDAEQGDKFGYSVDVTSDKILVSSRSKDGGRGAAYVYDISDLSAQPIKLTAFDASSYDLFGSSVAILGIPSPTPVSVDWSAPLTIGVATNTAFASTSKYDD